MTKVTWVEVDGYERYMISSDGRVRNWHSGLELKPRVSPGRGLFVYLLGYGTDNKTKFIHALMAVAFLDAPDHDYATMFTHHINGDAAHNVVSNLKIMAYPRKKFVPRKDPKPGDIRLVETGEVFTSMTSCAKHIGGHVSGISECLSPNSKRAQYRGYHFERVV